MSIVYRRLLAPTPSGEPPSAPASGFASLEEALDELTFPALADRPYAILNMIASTDGRATFKGRSGPLGNSADRELFHGLRTLVDAVMLGAGTLRVECYNRIVADPRARMQRLARGLAEEPLACVVSASLDLEPDIPLLADPGARVAVLTPSEATLGDVEADVTYLRAANEGELDLPASMRTLRERFAVRTLLCEGGPHLAGALVAAGLIDELFLTVAPMLIEGDVESEPEGGRSALSILSGPFLDPPVQLDIRSVLECESYLFLRYAVRA